MNASPEMPARGSDRASETGPTLVLPSQLQELSGGRAVLRLPGRPATVGEVLARLRDEHPGVHARLVTEQGELRPHINLFLDGEEVRRTGGLGTPVPGGAEILVLLSVSGG